MQLKLEAALVLGAVHKALVCRQKVFTAGVLSTSEMIRIHSLFRTDGSANRPVSFVWRQVQGLP
jgi:hypothetical protein